MEIQPIEYILNDIRSNITRNDNSDFIKKIYSKSLKDLSDGLKLNNSTGFKEFVAVNMLEKLSSHDKVDLENIDYLTELHDALFYNQDLKRKCYYYLSSCLCSYILETTDITQLFKLAKITTKVYQLCNEYEDSFICIENQAALLYYDYLIEFNETVKEERVLESVKYLKNITKLSYDVALTAEVFNEGIVQFIQKKIDDRKERLKPDGDIQNEFKIIEKMRCTKIGESEINKLNELEQSLLVFAPKEPKNYKFIKEFENFEYNMTSFDLPKSEEKPDLIKEENNRYFTLKVFRRTWKNKRYIIKEYELNIDLQQKEKLLVENRITKEAKCLQYLAGKELNSEFQTLKFYGLNKTDNKFTLTHEGYAKDLEDMIKDSIVNVSFTEDFLLGTISRLLKTFVDLENLNIYYQNISLKILINNEGKIIIPDLSYAVIKEECDLDLNDNLERQNFYWEEMVNGSKNKFGKQDVFALGIVILKLVNPYLGNIKKTQEFLNTSVEDLPYESIKTLLRKMLTLECRERYSFKNLNVISNQISQTRSALSSQSSTGSKRN